MANVPHDPVSHTQLGNWIEDGYDPSTDRSGSFTSPGYLTMQTKAMLEGKHTTTYLLHLPYINSYILVLT